MFPRTACKYSPMAAEKIAEMQKAQKIFVMSLAEELLGRNFTQCTAKKYVMHCVKNSSKRQWHKKTQPGGAALFL